MVVGYNCTGLPECPNTFEIDEYAQALLSSHKQAWARPAHVERNPASRRQVNFSLGLTEDKYFARLDLYWNRSASYKRYSSRVQLAAAICQIARSLRYLWHRFTPTMPCMYSMGSRIKSRHAGISRCGWYSSFLLYSYSHPKKVLTAKDLATTRPPEIPPHP